MAVNSAIMKLTPFDELETGGFLELLNIDGEKYVVSADVIASDIETEAVIHFIRAENELIRDRAEEKNLETVEYDSLEDVYKRIAKIHRESELGLIKSVASERIKNGKDEQRQGETWRKGISEKVKGLWFRR